MKLDYAVARLEPFYQFGLSFLVIMKMLNCAVRWDAGPRERQLKYNFSL
jgi:hypothetical protein